MNIIVKSEGSALLSICRQVKNLERYERNIYESHFVRKWKKSNSRELSIGVIYSPPRW